jgi:hypothetical protein
VSLAATVSNASATTAPPSTSSHLKLFTHCRRLATSSFFPGSQIETPDSLQHGAYRVKRIEPLYTRVTTRKAQVAAGSTDQSRSSRRHRVRPLTTLCFGFPLERIQIQLLFRLIYPAKKAVKPQFQPTRLQSETWPVRISFTLAATIELADRNAPILPKQMSAKN